MLQHTDEWLFARCGKVTASRIADVVARTKTGWGASRARYEAELVMERITGMPLPQFVSDAMRWGTMVEPDARDCYSWRTDRNIVEVGFIQHPTIEWAGASPDGFVGDKGLVEIKCPIPSTHLATLRTKSIPDEYIKQMHWQMECTGREWCDWVSYDPRWPPHLSYFCKRVERDEKMCAYLRNNTIDFLQGIEATLAELEKDYPHD